MKTFTPNNLDNSFKKWSEKGLTYLYQLFDGDLLQTFEHLKIAFDLPSTNFFRYLQLRAFLTTHEEWNKFTKPTPLEKYLIKLQTGDGKKKIISKLYNIFLSMNTNSSQIREMGDRGQHCHI